MDIVCEGERESWGLVGERLLPLCVIFVVSLVSTTGEFETRREIEKKVVYASLARFAGLYLYSEHSILHNNIICFYQLVLFTPPFLHVLESICFEVYLVNSTKEGKRTRYDMRYYV